MSDPTPPPSSSSPHPADELRAVARRYAESMARFLAAHKETEKHVRGLVENVEDLVVEVARPCAPALKACAIFYEGCTMLARWAGERAQVGASVLEDATCALKHTHDQMSLPRWPDAIKMLEQAWENAASLRPEEPSSPPTQPEPLQVPTLGGAASEAVAREFIARFEVAPSDSSAGRAVTSLREWLAC